MLLAAAGLVFLSASPVEGEVREERVFEPIFQSQVVIHESGCEHEQSVVLVHGLGDDAARDWDPVLPSLAERYHVVTVDLPGFGRSEKKNTLYSPFHYAAFLKWLVDRSVDGEFSVIGHSMGGAVALRFAATFPKGLRRLVLVDVAGILHGAAFARFHADASLERKLGGDSSVSYDYLSRLTGAVIHRFQTPVDPSTLLGSPAFRQKFLNADPLRIAALALIEEDFSLLAPAVTTPTTIIWGEQDPVAPPRVAWLLGSRIPGTRLRFMPGVGHVPMEEQPEQLAELLHESLADPWQSDIRPEPEPSNRVGVCRNENAVVFVGAYDRIEIEGCAGATLLGVRASRIDVTGSSVEVMGGRIASDATALTVRDSWLRATNLKVSGETALVVSDSNLDLAGTDLVGTAAAIRVEEKSHVIFSLCSVASPQATGPRHDAITLKKDQLL